MRKINKKIKYIYRGILIRGYCAKHKKNPYTLIAEVLDKSNDSVRINIASEIGENNEDAAHVLGITERTFYRLKKDCEK